MHGAPITNITEINLSLRSPCIIFASSKRYPQTGIIISTTMILFNNQLTENAAFDEKKLEDGLSIYEVVRVFGNTPIFLSDNLQRLSNSLKKSNIQIQVESLNIPEKLGRLIAMEHISEGNLKYVLHFTAGRMDEYIYQIPHSYPTSRDYSQGVAVMTYPAVRENPEIKYINYNFRELMNHLIREHQVYEILLRDQENYITEGSRSNVFMIRKNVLYTAPTDYVLPGTSRKRVLDICKQHRIRVIEERIPYAALKDFDAAFLTGTSPLILPINCIDVISFNPGNPLLRQLMNYYFALLEN